MRLRLLFVFGVVSGWFFVAGLDGLPQVAVFAHAIAVATDIDDVTVVHESVDQRREGLQVVKKRRKRKCLGMTTQWVHRAEYPNHVWSYDFVYDQTEDGRQLKCLTVVDEFARLGLPTSFISTLNTSDAPGAAVCR